MSKAKEPSQEDDLGLDNREIQEQLVEMAVDQFARLLWQRCLLDQWKIKNRRKYKISKAPSPISRTVYVS